MYKIYIAWAGAISKQEDRKKIWEQQLSLPSDLGLVRLRGHCFGYLLFPEFFFWLWSPQFKIIQMSII